VREGDGEEAREKGRGGCQSEAKREK
jgi:hypothetical protein